MGSWYNKIIELDVVESTMDEARKLGFVDEGTVLVARSQTGGRGRQGGNGIHLTEVYGLR